MQSSSSSAGTMQVLWGAAWLILGLFLLIAFFLPNYTTPVIDIDGLDLLKTATRDPEALSRLTRDAETFFMVLTPFVYWFLGFISVVIGIFNLSGKGGKLGMLLILLAALTIVLSIITIVVLENRNDAPGLFAKMFPKPGTVFYLTVMAEAGILVVGVLQRMLSTRK